MEQSEEQGAKQSKDEGESIIPYWYRTEFLALPERKRTLEETLEETWGKTGKAGKEEESEEESNWTAKFKWLKEKIEKKRQKSSEGTYEKESIFVSCISEESDEEEMKKPLKYEAVKELERIQEEEERKILESMEAMGSNGVMQALYDLMSKLKYQ